MQTSEDHHVCPPCRLPLFLPICLPPSLLLYYDFLSSLYVFVYLMLLFLTPPSLPLSFSLSSLVSTAVSGASFCYSFVSFLSSLCIYTHMLLINYYKIFNAKVMILKTSVFADLAFVTLVTGAF